MRKLSKTSVSSNFSKRSASVSSIHEVEPDEGSEGSYANGGGRKDLVTFRSAELPHEMDQQMSRSPRRFGLLERPSFSGPTRKSTRYHSYMSHSVDHSNAGKDRLSDLGSKQKTAERSRGPSKAVSIEGLRTWFEKS